MKKIPPFPLPNDTTHSKLRHLSDQLANLEEATLALTAMLMGIELADIEPASRPVPDPPLTPLNETMTKGNAWKSISIPNHASEKTKVGLSAAKAKGTKLGRPLDQKKRAKLLRWQEAKLPVKEQAKRLGISQAAVYAYRRRLDLH